MTELKKNSMRKWKYLVISFIMNFSQNLFNKWFCILVLYLKIVAGESNKIITSWICSGKWIPVSIFIWNVNKNIAYYWSLIWWFTNHGYTSPPWEMISHIFCIFLQILQSRHGAACPKPKRGIAPVCRSLCLWTESSVHVWFDMYIYMSLLIFRLCLYFIQPNWDLSTYKI